MQTISIVGLGRMGGALAIALSKAGYKIDHLITKKPSQQNNKILPKASVLIEDVLRIDSDIVFITTGDGEIASAAELISSKLNTDAVVLHTSGLLDSSEFKSLAKAGNSFGSMHPLVSISDPESGSTRFAGANFCIEGDEIALSTIKSIVDSLGGTHFSISGSAKPLYHASAVMAAGNSVALFDIAVEMMSKSGVDPEKAKQLLLNLLQSVVKNLNERSTADSLTGSFARGDVFAFEKHLGAMTENVSKEILHTFLLLGEHSVKMVADVNADKELNKELTEKIKMAKNDLEC